MPSPVRTVAVVLGGAVLTLAGCTAAAQERVPRQTVVQPVTSTRPTASRTATPTPTPMRTSTPDPTPERTPTPPRPVVVLDPGHNGGNGAHPEVIGRPVPAGGGRTKPCNTTGTATGGGYPEHAFNWAVALRVRAVLRRHGARVLLTRPNDSGVGPCVDTRAAIGNAARARAVVSIHGDGAATGHGFHVIRADNDSAGAAIDAASDRLATVVRDQLATHSGLTPSTYRGTAGFDRRGDLAGLTLSRRPTVMVECGNMRDRGDAARMTSAAGQRAIADAIAAGVQQYLADG